MIIFGNPGGRGCFMVVNVDTSGGRNVQLQLPNGDRIPSEFATDPFIVVDVKVVAKEALVAHAGLDDSVFTYFFGHDPDASFMVIGLLGMMKGPSGDDTGTFAAVYRAYKENRAYAAGGRKAQVYMSGAAVLSGDVIGFSAGAADAETNLQRFDITLSLPRL